MTGPVVLSLDTSTVAAVGLARHHTVLASLTVDDPRRHVEELIVLVHRALEGADLRLADVDHIVVGVGPGPFTGLRVGIATAATLGLAAAIPVRGICSLDAIAAQLTVDSVPSGDFVVATDARRKEVYWARYGPDGRRLDGPTVGVPESLPALPTVGPATTVYPDRLQVGPGPRSLDPGLLAAAGLDLPDAGTEPLYLRRPDAAEPTRPKSVLLTRPPLPPRTRRRTP
jgi:tRNA threonylcarbamoyl adenosine modification protein YeaZ